MVIELASRANNRQRRSLTPPKPPPLFPTLGVPTLTLTWQQGWDGLIFEPFVRFFVNNQWAGRPYVPL
ncbi:hypothetical protein LshimejAT787_0503360 [Lyophyllum shimeji]|uniref:Uncharacterized protein n=1 Tax=Lyophyllum shimeji TaxID=47721 RepID=A0A9P3UPN9_LYOSH|nr:hypothetical protein LshimejAT787_0503360 [Lyophyllum shimeji]